ncbi:MAG: hypothetical protein JW798_03740 [Prolixibacteraceae bacterium]|nr:hypothetical protein [Prolixibacteraceae bacterium]
MNKVTYCFLIVIFLLNSTFALAGKKVEGAIVSLNNAQNMDLYSSTETGEFGEILFEDVEPGEYILSIKIPFTSLTDNSKYEAFLERLINGGCDKENGRLVFKINNNCFVLDMNCEDSPSAKMTPYFNISEEETGYLITIAKTSVQKKYKLTGLFQSLLPHNYEECLKSGKFQLLF